MPEKRRRFDVDFRQGAIRIIGTNKPIVKATALSNTMRK